MTKVKICGITNLEDALLSAKFGADALGFNFYEKSLRYVSPEKAGEIIEQLPKEVLKVGVFVNEDLEKIVEIAKIAKLDALQLHGEETPEFVRELKRKTDLEIIKAFRVSPDFALEDVLKYETDAILLDAYSPKERGGTGETFDWEIAKKVQKIFPKMYLAGGLDHENVIRSIYDTKALAVDVCSGIEASSGAKDRIKLINFISKVKNRENNENETFIDFLSFIQRYPTMIVGDKSLTLLHSFLIGFEMALKQSKAEYNTYLFFTEFDGFVRKKLNDKLGANSWCWRILHAVESDEEKAVDLFFALFEEFKLEKEDLGNE